MTSTSCEAAARRVLDDCLAGRAPDRLPPELLTDECARALFGVLVEGLADRFDPALCDIYASLFSQALPGADLARYERVRLPRPVRCDPRRVYVLSRITLGADIAVTSVLMDAAKRRFPNASIVFVGPRKNYELFAADPRVMHAPLEYRKGTLHDRLAAAHELAGIVDDLVLDPDSRLTQLGLLPVGDEQRYHLFESRRYGSESRDALPQLAAQWAATTLGVTDARPYIAVRREAVILPPEYVAVSLGVGENPAKRLADPFEPELLKLLGARHPLVIDRGAGGEERARVERAVAAAGVSPTYWDGSFAGFASIVSGARLYVGYDSAGQHAAAASGVPLITIFAGWAAPRMFDRWRPVSPNAMVIRCDSPDPEAALSAVRAASR
ncbi:MAG TPA: glycosyltransferase family 9 protein [Candidatus Acidoferrum sp.]|nr:glycosyltransferase family 9 protein [Candidatus Acidoferrum sp.]